MSQATRKQTSFIKFLFDISGVPNKGKSGEYELVIVGCVSVNAITLNDLLDNFKSDFPTLWDKKGSQLTAEQLEIVIDYLNNNKARMLSVPFRPVDWQKYKRKFKDEAHLEEKIMSLLYFKPLNVFTRQSSTYTVLYDSDTTFNIKQSVKLVQRLSRQLGYTFQPSFGYADLNLELKFADWVASARRKMDEDTLRKYRYYYLLNSKIPHNQLKYVFKTL